MAINNLISVDLVTAGGDFLTASDDEHNDLFWALRGGGGNFGVVTSFEFRLHPVDQVLAGMLVWPIDQLRGLMEHYREFTRDNPEEMTFYLETGTDPESGTRIAAIAGIYPGEIAKGERLVDGLRAFSPPIADMIEPMPYRNFQMAFDEEFPHGRRYYWKGLLLREIHDAVIDAVAEAESAVPLPGCIIAIEHYRGAMNRVPVGATAFAHRNAQYQLVIIGGCDDPGDDERVKEWVRGLYTAAQPYGLNAPFLNFNSVEPTEQLSAVRTSFGPNYNRLARIKRQYDPGNLFHGNNNIPPE